MFQKMKKEKYENLLKSNKHSIVVDEEDTYIDLFSKENK